MAAPLKKKKRDRRLQYWLLNHIGVPVFWYLCRIYSLFIRLRVEGLEKAEELKGKPFVFTITHRDMATGVLAMMRLGWLQKMDYTWITSPSDDGQLQARVLQRAGAHTVIGSSSRRSSEALLALHHELKKNRVVCLAVDGPRGPALKAKPGAAHLAVEAKVPIMLFDVSPERYWTVRDWASTHFPKPFSKVHLKHLVLEEVESVEAGTEWLTANLHELKGATREEAS